MVGEFASVAELGRSLTTTMREMYNGQPAPLNPQELLVSIWRSVIHLAGYAQQDAHEFFIATLNGLHAADTEGVKKGANTNLGEYPSIADSIFGGKLQSDVMCTACNNVSTRVDPVHDVSLDIRTLPSSVNGQVSLEEGLKRYTAPENLVGGEMPTCPQCQRRTEAVKQSTFAALPPILCLHLKRFAPDTDGEFRKIDETVLCPMSDLDMSSYQTTQVPISYVLPCNYMDAYACWPLPALMIIISDPPPSRDIVQTSAFCC